MKQRYFWIQAYQAGQWNTLPAMDQSDDALNRFADYVHNGGFERLTLSISYPQEDANQQAQYRRLIDLAPDQVIDIDPEIYQELQVIMAQKASETNQPQQPLGFHVQAGGDGQTHQSFANEQQNQQINPFHQNAQQSPPQQNPQQNHSLSRSQPAEMDMSFNMGDDGLDDMMDNPQGNKARRSMIKLLSLMFAFVMLIVIGVGALILYSPWKLPFIDELVGQSESLSAIIGEQRPIAMAQPKANTKPSPILNETADEVLAFVEQDEAEILSELERAERELRELSALIEGEIPTNDADGMTELGEIELAQAESQTPTRKAVQSQTPNIPKPAQQSASTKRYFYQHDGFSYPVLPPLLASQIQGLDGQKRRVNNAPSLISQVNEGGDDLLAMTSPANRPEINMPRRNQRSLLDGEDLMPRIGMVQDGQENRQTRGQGGQNDNRDFFNQAPLALDISYYQSLLKTLSWSDRLSDVQGIMEDCKNIDSQFRVCRLTKEKWFDDSSGVLAQFDRQDGNRLVAVQIYGKPINGEQAAKARFDEIVAALDEMMPLRQNGFHTRRHPEGTDFFYTLKNEPDKISHFSYWPDKQGRFPVFVYAKLTPIDEQRGYYHVLIGDPMSAVQNQNRLFGGRS